jgi:DNA-binding MarR family transcriptional regulator
MPKTTNVDRVTNAIDRLFHLVIREGGRLGDPPDRAMTNTQSIALRIVTEQGPLRLWALAEQMRTTDATATRTVDALEAAGLVARKAEPADRRGVIVAVTRRGETVFAARRKRMRIVVGHLVEGIPESDLDRIAAFLEELNERLTQDEEAAEPRSGVSA